MTLNTINNQICAVILLSLILMTQIVCGRPRLDLGAVGMASLSSAASVSSHSDIPQVLLNELLTNTNEDALYSELKKYHYQQPNYLIKWPGLRDLLLTVDYDENAANAIESNEAINSRFIERLRQLAATAVDDVEDTRENNNFDNINNNDDNTNNDNNNNAVNDDVNNDVGYDGTPELSAAAVPQNKFSATVAGSRLAYKKEHAVKKNVQYMSPCHFKICNFGRKRDARFFANN